MSTRELLCRVRQRLSRPAAWTKRAPARDENGNTCAPRSARAVAWSLSGAVEAEMDGARETAGAHQYYHAMTLLLDVLGPTYQVAADYEDDPTTTHAMVLRVLDCAIVAATRRHEGTS